MAEVLKQKYIDESTKKLTHRHYVTQFSQGYRFEENVQAIEVGDVTRKYESKGLEVFVGQTAFSETGAFPNKWKMRAVLTRRKN